MRRVLLPAALVLALGAASCGGSSRHTIGTAPATQRQSGLLGGTSAANSSAGTVRSYQPTGNIVADDGFRPWVDGFGFENYGNDVGPENMTAAQVRDLFGSQVCAGGAGTRCRLTPVAQEWMAAENSRMAGGHCMGFSVTALEFFAQYRSTEDYGAKTAIKLPIQGNVDLQSLVAENWTFQDLPSVRQRRVTGTPTAVLHKLMDALDRDKELYTIAIFKRDGNGGHAVTPFAVEDRGHGKFAILVYDNNFPGAVRAIRVDTNANTWRYVGGPDPSDTNELYDGDAQTRSLSLFPTSPGLARQPCPFCSGARGRGNSAATGSVLPLVDQYDQLTLIGNAANHGHLILRDAQDRVTGFVGGRGVNHIPGVRVQTTITSQNWRVAPEPTYLIPPHLAVSVTLDGSDLVRPDRERVDLIGRGLYAQVDEIELKPGETNVVDFRGGATGFTFHTDPHHDQTPLLASAIDEGKADYGFAPLAVGVKGGSSLTMYIDKETGELALDTRGTTGNIAKTGYAVYVLSVVRETAQGKAVWVADKLLLKRGQLALVDYRHAPAAGKPLEIIVGAPGGKISFEKAQPQKTK